MLILVLDSSTGVVTVAVARAGENAPSAGEARREVLAEISATSRGASETLLPAAHAALNLAGTDLGEVERILVGVGPGTLPASASLCRRACPGLRPVPRSPGTRAERPCRSRLSRRRAPDVLAVLDAKRRQVFAQLFASDGSRGEICARRRGACGATFGERGVAEKEMLLVGDGAVRYREELPGLAHPR